MYTVDDPSKRAVGFNLSEGMEVPAELASAVQVREPEVETSRNHCGSFFAFKNDY